jgi:hypothetical protein
VAILNKVQESFHDDTDAAMISQPSDCRGLNGEPLNDKRNGDDAAAEYDTDAARFEREPLNDKGNGDDAAAEYDTDVAMISQPSDCRGLNGEPQ